MINRIADRYRDIASGKNTDSSDEYYTLYPAFAAAFIELLCRYKAGKEYINKTKNKECVLFGKDQLKRIK